MFSHIGKPGIESASQVNKNFPQKGITKPDANLILSKYLFKNYLFMKRKAAQSAKCLSEEADPSSSDLGLVSRN